MKKQVSYLLIIAFVLCSSIAQSQIYGGLGTGYIAPFSKFEESNKSSSSYIINLENRYYCNIWYGLKIEYSEFQSSDNLPSTSPYYENMVNFMPQVRYNFLGLNCYDNSVFPYLQLGLSINSIGRTDNSSRLGLGFSGGGGVSYGFNAFSTCFILDGNVSYNMPNIIVRDELRDEIQFMHINLTLNVKL